MQKCTTKPYSTYKVMGVQKDFPAHLEHNHSKRVNREVDPFTFVHFNPITLTTYKGKTQAYPSQAFIIFY